MRKALLIGINYLGQSLQLNGCIDDVLNVQLLLQKIHPDIVIHLMTETQGDGSMVPTFANIIKQFNWLCSDNSGGDSLFIHYSGHGSHQPDRSGDEPDRQDELLVPLDFDKAGMISDDIVRSQLSSRIQAGVRLFGLFDSCFSGTIMDLKYHYFNGKHVEIENSPETAGEIIMISGCTDAQQSNETVINGRPRGILTTAFVQTCTDLIPKTRGAAYIKIEPDRSVRNKIILSKAAASETRINTDLLRISFLDVITQILASVEKTVGKIQVPRLSSGRPLDLNTTFSIM